MEAFTYFSEMECHLRYGCLMNSNLFQKVPSSRETEIAAFILRVHSLKSVVSNSDFPSIPDFHPSHLADTATSILNLFDGLSRGCLGPALRALPSRPIREWEAETRATIRTSRSRKERRGRLLAEVNYILVQGRKISSMIEDQSASLYLLKLLEVVERLGKPLKLKPSRDFAHVEESFETAVTGTLLMNWSEFAPIPRGSWRSFPSAVSNILSSAESAAKTAA